jgi:putative flippase GtrA
MHAILLRVLTPGQQAVLAQFMRFGTVGAMGFVVDNATVYGLRGFVGLYWAGALAYLVSASFAWMCNRLWTFRGRGSGAVHRQWMLFLAANLIGFILNRGTYFILITVSPVCAEYPVLAIFAGTLMGMFMNFHMSRTVVFR